MDHFSYVETFGMTERELADRLHGVEAGVLALADDGDGEKLSFVRATETATFVAFGTDDTDSWSVLLRGPLVELDGDERESVLADPEAFGPVRLFDEAVVDIEVRVFDLEPEPVTGRQAAGVDAWRAIAETGEE